MGSEHYFDKVTKLLAGNLPRRDALRRLGAVVAGALWGSAGLSEPAEGAATSDCVAYCNHKFKTSKDRTCCLLTCKICPSTALLCGTTASKLTCCLSGVCTSAGICKPATCIDGVKNGTETDVDCGGSKCPKCANGKRCSKSSDCQSGKCKSGICQGPDLCAGVVCAAIDQCHTAGVCNPTTGICSNPSKANGTACSDGNACTTGDTCQSGVCTGGNPVLCPPPDQCHTQGVCNPATGQCSNPAKADGTACNDGNACTQTDTCQSGVCVGANPIVCTPIDQCHTAGTCDPATGVCSNPPKADGTTCNDGMPGTVNDTCQAGVCVGSPPSPGYCDDGNPCTADSFNSTTGMCEHSPTNEGGSCLGDGVCQGGMCVEVDLCAGVVCTASDQCHNAGVCNPATGQCSNPPKADGTACTDGDACTQNDTCQSGICVSGTPVICTALSPCHTVGVCNPATGACSNPAKPDGTACEDGNLCTPNDFCVAGVCMPGSPANCDDGNSCTIDSCDPQVGCVHTYLPSGTACNDGNPCTQGDVCNGAGVCSGGTPVVCTAANANGVCNPATGQCNFTCNSGFANCDGTFSNGCETNTQTNSNNCGGCGIVCGPGRNCVSGNCMLS